MERILCNNAYESWKNAYKYHIAILNGFFTLGNKKGFIASLHNAVELYLKQSMLDDNEQKVAWVRSSILNSEEGRRLKANYDQANNLNCFFSNLPSEQLSFFQSATFSSFIDGENSQYMYLKLNVEPGERENYKEALTVLNILRNAETHFYIDEREYLNEKDFVCLWRFMKVFFELIEEKGYLPFVKINTSSGEMTVNSHLFKVRTDNRCANSFTYVSVLKNNPKYKKIIDRIAKIQEFTGSAISSDIENLSFEVWRYGKGNHFNLSGIEELEEISEIVLLMKTYNIIKIIPTNYNECYNEYSDDYELEQSYFVKIQE